MSHWKQQDNEAKQTAPLHQLGGEVRALHLDATSSNDAPPKLASSHAPDHMGGGFVALRQHYVYMPHEHHKACMAPEKPTSYQLKKEQQFVASFCSGKKLGWGSGMWLPQLQPKVQGGSVKPSLQGCLFWLSDYGPKANIIVGVTIVYNEKMYMHKHVIKNDIK